MLNVALFLLTISSVLSGNPSSLLRLQGGRCRFLSGTRFIRLGTFFVQLGTLFVQLGTLFVQLWTFFVQLWTFFVQLWTFFVQLWTLFVQLWTFSVQLWTFFVQLWTLFVQLWTLFVPDAGCGFPGKMPYSPGNLSSRQAGTFCLQCRQSCFTLFRDANPRVAAIDWGCLLFRRPAS